MSGIIDLLLHTYVYTYVYKFSPKATTGLSQDVAMSLCYYFMVVPYLNVYVCSQVMYILTQSHTCVRTSHNIP